MNQLDETTDSASITNALSSTIDSEKIEVWRTGALKLSDITLPFPDACIDELEQALSRTGDVEQPDTTDRKNFKHCEELCRELVHRLESPSLGATIINALPAERYNELDNKRMCGTLSSLVGKLMVQNKDGVTLYDVKNKNPKNPDKVRKSITNQAQPYHTDGGWHHKPANYVGLYCVRNAKSGGGSKITSMLTAFEAMKSHPEHLKTLLMSHPWDMQGEHAAHESGVQMNPVFEVHKGKFMSRYYDSYIRKGYTKSGESVSDDLDAALKCLADVINSQASIKFEMTTGQFQYLNNWTVLHAREAFADTQVTPKSETRHVIRVWNQ